jgi:hypothetical protein
MVPTNHRGILPGSDMINTSKQFLYEFRVWLIRPQLYSNRIYFLVEEVASKQNTQGKNHQQAKEQGSSV